MNDMKECFENLVGLSRSECDCFETIDERHKESKMGLWLDEHEGVDLQLIQNALGCAEELNGKFERIYSNAVNFLESDLQVAISDNFRQKYKAYNGRVGEKKFDRPVNAAQMVGLKLKTEPVDGANIIVNSVDLFFDTVGEIEIHVFKNETFVESHVIDITANRQTFEFPVPLSLPIMENGIRNEYYFVYEKNAMKPMNNKTSCGCQGTESVRSKFLTPQGVKGTSFGDLGLDQNHAFGLSLNVFISCSLDNLICGFMYDSVFERRTAMALWYKMGVLLIESLFASREINFDTFTDREYLYTRKKKFESLYANLVLWLSENSNINDSNCFICDTKKGVSMGKILL